MKCLNGWKKSPDAVTGGSTMNGGIGLKPKEATAAAAAAFIAVEETDAPNEFDGIATGEGSSSRQLIPVTGSGNRRGCWNIFFRRASPRFAGGGPSSPSDKSSS